MWRSREGFWTRFVRTTVVSVWALSLGLGSELAQGALGLRLAHTHDGMGSEEVPTTQYLISQLGAAPSHIVELVAYDGYRSQRFAKAMIGTAEEGEAREGQFVLLDGRLLCLVTEQERYYVGYILKDGRVSLVEGATPVLRQSPAFLLKSVDRCELTFSKVGVLPLRAQILSDYAGRCLAYATAEGPTAKELAWSSINTLREEMMRAGDPYLNRIAAVVVPRVATIGRLAKESRRLGAPGSNPGEFLMAAIEMYDGVRNIPAEFSELISEWRASATTVTLQDWLERIGMIIEEMGTPGRFLMSLLPEGTAKNVVHYLPSCLQNLFGVPEAPVIAGEGLEPPTKGL